jgi:LCP family protein required for cell wall assembly
MKPRVRPIHPQFFFGIALFVFVVGLVGVLLLKHGLIRPFIAPAKTFFFPPAGTIQSSDGRTNILLMGKGGKGHEAPDLTDTMMVVSLSKRDNKITLLSIPRDIWVDSLKAKINSAYYWGKQESETQGIPKAKQIVNELLGIPIHYAVVVDFSGFTRAIDAVGGIEVDVESAFTDNRYPIAGRENDDCGGDKTYACRYETIVFEKGKQLMDGARALKFVRSRYAEGDNGTDFARAARQQKVIEALKDKILDSGVLFSPEKVKNLMTIAEESVETDIDQAQAGALGRIAFDARDNISTVVVGEDQVARAPTGRKYAWANQYVLIPKVSWDDVRNWVKSNLP